MISIIIPLYNKEKHIKETLNSVLNQSFKNFEVIIIDDHSADNSRNIVNEIKDNRITIYTNPKKGVSSARNYGINLSKNKYVALLDADDIWDLNYLSEIITLINEYPLAGAYCSGWAYFDDDKNVTFPFNNFAFNFKDYISNYFEKAIENSIITSSSVIMDKSIFKKTKGFDENLEIGEDIDLWIRLALITKICYINKCLVLYRKNSSSDKIQIKNNTKSLINNLTKYNKIEKENYALKRFLDYWRYFKLIDCLENRSNEIISSKKILKQIDLSNFQRIFRLINLLPEFTHKPIYSLYKIYYTIIN
jgi:glycosyltransferase involved in cell wall biosynthesis